MTSRPLVANPITTHIIHGWCATQHLLPLFKELDQFQRQELGLECGDTLEIGLQHGKFFFLLTQLMHSDEYALGIDLFLNQDENVDHSGSGCDISFCQMFAQRFMGINWREHIELLEANSMALIPADLEGRLRVRGGSGGGGGGSSGRGGSECKEAPRKYRFASIDGGHTCLNTVHDLELVAQVMDPRGVICLDDYWHTGWHGVKQGGDLFLRRQDTWVPFYVSPLVDGTNKLMLCHRDYADAYIADFRGKYLNCYTPGMSLKKPKQNPERGTVWNNI